MSQEHKRGINRRVEDGPRALLAGLLLLSPTSVANSLSSITDLASRAFSARSAVAAELQKPQEQAPVGNIETDFQELVKAVESKDFNWAVSFFADERNKNFIPDWGTFGSPQRKKIPGNELAARFFELLKQNPNCLGAKWAGRTFKYPTAYFKLDKGYVGISLGPNHVEIRNTINLIEEIPEGLSTQALANLESCPPGTGKTQIVKKTETLDFEYEPFVVDLPQSIREAQVVHEGQATAGGTTIFLSTVSAEGSKQLLNANKNEYNRSPRLIGSNVVYESYTSGGYGLNIYDTKLNKTQTIAKGEAVKDACPAEHPEGGIIHKSSDTILWRTGSKVETLISYGAVGCSIMSPDGEFLVFQSKDGLAIARKNDNFQKIEVLLEGAVVPLDVSKKDGSILYMSGEKYQSEDGGNLYLYQNGKSKQIARRAFGGSFNPLGNLVIYSQKFQQNDSFAHYLYIEGEGRIRSHSSNSPIWYPVWERDGKVNIINLPTRKTIAIVPGLGSAMENGQLKGGLIDNFLNITTGERGYQVSDIVIPSLGGWRFTESGSYLAKDQGCEDVLRGEDMNGAYIAQFLREHAIYRPNNEIVLITHSLGSIRTLAGLFELLKDENYDFSKLTLITTHGPNIGIDKPGWEYAFAPASFFNLPDNCNLIFGIPYPSSINYPAVVELKKMWQNRELVRVLRRELTETLKQRGAKVYALGNYQDCVMDTITCHLGEIALEIRMLINSTNLPVLTQELPGAINIMRSMGRNGWLRPFADIGLGHNTFWDTEEGLGILTAIVGDQISQSPDKDSAIRNNIARQPKKNPGQIAA